MASRWFRVLVALCACFLCFYLVDEAARFAAWFGCGAYAPFYCPHAFSGLSWRSAQGALSRLRRKLTGDRPAPAPSPPSVGPRPPTGALPARFLPDVKQDVKRQKIEVCGGKCFDNLFTLTSAHLFSRERKYFFSRAHTFFLTIKNVGTHSFGAQKADLRAARRASAGSFFSAAVFLRCAWCAVGRMLCALPPLFAYQRGLYPSKKALETDASSAMGKCVGEGLLYRPIQASGLSGDVSRRNWKWSVQLPDPSPATLPSVWRVPTCCPLCTLTLDRLQ